VHELVEILRNPKVVSMVPAAPELPSTSSAREATAQVEVEVPAAVVEVDVELVVAASDELVVGPLVDEADLLGCEHDVNARAPVTASAPARTTTPRVSRRSPKLFRS
jgi:hypothetical protein